MALLVCALLYRPLRPLWKRSLLRLGASWLSGHARSSRDPHLQQPNGASKGLCRFKPCWSKNKAGRRAGVPPTEI